MRSQLMILSLISLAVSGCGKEVRREAATATQANPAGSPSLRSTELRAGECGDRIGEPAYKRIERFSDVSQRGVYDLVAFEAVGQTLTPGGATVDGVSVVAATVKSGAVEFAQVCSDLEKMPTQTMDWSVSAPTAMAAIDGSITKETHFSQRIFGPAVLDPSGQKKMSENTPSESTTACSSATVMLSGVEGCGGAKFYQMDPTSIGVLRTVTTKSATGAIVTSKIFAQYVLVGGPVEPVEPTVKTEKTESKKVESTGTGNQGSVKKSTGTGNQGTGNQGTGNQGSADVGTSTTVVVHETVSTVPAVVVVAPAETQDEAVVMKAKTKTKTKTKEKSVSNAISGDESMKTTTKMKSKSKTKTKMKSKPKKISS